MTCYKKIFTALLTIAILLTAVMSVGATALSGDLNNDSVVDVKDATYLQKILVALEPAPENLETVADTFKDSKIDVRDVTVIQMYNAKIISTLPFNPNVQDEANPTEPSASTPEPTETTTLPTETTEPVTKPTTEPVTKPVTDPTTKPTTKPTTQPATDDEGWNNQVVKP